MDTTNWKWFRIGDVFDVRPGIYHYSSEYEDGGTPYLSATAVNNGIGKTIDLSPEFEGGVVSTEKVGCTSFYQPNDFCATSDVNIIRLKNGEKLNKYVGLFLSSIIEFNEGFRWTYGRQCRVENTKNIKIKLPVAVDGTPDWQYMEDYVKNAIIPQLPEQARAVSEGKYDISPARNNSINLKHTKWANFKIGDIFNIQRGHTLTSEQKDLIGDIPCVNGSTENNGILCYLSESLLDEGFILQSVPSLSLCRVGTSGATFIQNKPYFIADNAFSLRTKEEHSISVYVFLSTILDQECIKYSYGRTISSVKYMETVVSLPAIANPDGTYSPDWQFMEDYIKSLPYSKNI